MSLTVASSTSVSLAQSRAFCEQLTRDAAKNFYYGLRLLPEPKRSSMFALYAYMRLCDDIADDEDGRSVQQRQDDLEAWRERTHAALEGRLPAGEEHALWPAFVEMVRRHQMPPHVFDDVIAGQRQDLESQTFQTFPQLYEYCYQVAGVVGLASIYVWGFEGGAETETLAIKRGVAFQLTNILRDLVEDAQKGRSYLPREELAGMGVNDADLRVGRGGENFLRLMRFQIARAQSYYEQSAPLESRIESDCRPTLIAMTEIYRGLLRKVAKDPQRVLRERVSLSLASKLYIGWRAAWAS